MIIKLQFYWNLQNRWIERFSGILTVYDKYWNTSKYEDLSVTYTHSILLVLSLSLSLSVSFIFVTTIIFIFLVNKKQQTLHILLLGSAWLGWKYVSWEMNPVCCWELHLTICQRLTSYNVIGQHNSFQRFLSDQQSEFIIFSSLGCTANYLEVTSKNTVFYRVFICDGWVS